MPEVSVVLPAYESHATLGRCLVALEAQTFRDFEVIVVDSSPTDAGAKVAATHPGVRLVRSRDRLLPHAARARGVAEARGRLIVSADPDVFPETVWLERLVAAHRETGLVVTGALECDGDAWLDRGIHLCKFGKWLPAGPARPVDMAPTANLLLTVESLRAAGGFPGASFLGDVDLSWNLAARGETIWFEPGAVVRHRHLSTLRSFLVERRDRGRLYGDLRLARREASRLEAALWFAVTILPIRLLSNLGHVLRQAGRAGRLGELARTMPIVVGGFAASLWGEAGAYAAALSSRARPAASEREGRGSVSS